MKIKAFLALLLGVASCFLLVGGTARHDFKATFHKGGYFRFSQDAEPYSVILRTHDELSRYIDSVIAENIIDSKEFLEEQKKQIKKFYCRYDDEFFKNNILVIALIDIGSGSYKHELKSLSVTDRVLTANIKRSVGQIMTMDYVPWFLTLELNRQKYDISSVQIYLKK